MEVTGLTPGHEYEFRVKAVNKEGESEPLVTLSSIIAKDPFGKYCLLNFHLNSFTFTDFQRRKYTNCHVFAVVPTEPGAPEPTDWNQNQVDLIWREPVSDGGAPISGYIIEKKDKYRCDIIIGSQ